jgi:hypothetical protein
MDFDYAVKWLTEYLDELWDVIEHDQDPCFHDLNNFTFTICETVSPYFGEN